MKVGISISNFSWPIPLTDFGSTVARIARTADDAGVDSLWVMDHFFQIRVTGEPPEAPITEAYATLSFLAGQTRRATLGTLVTSVSYRHPGVLLKTVTALDVLSGGRAVLGIGAGAPWNPEPAGPGTAFEAEGLGIPFPSLAERFERLDETLQIAHQMWRADETPFRGRHYDLARPLNSPNSLQRPHPPILIGGSGEKKTLRLVARYGDACSLFDLPGSQFADNIEHKLGVLREHCAAENRDYAEIEKTIASTFDQGDDPEAAHPKAALPGLLAHLRELAALGIDHVLLACRGPWTDATLDALVSVIPDIHAIETAGR
jgi:F420-dependent oxidoreductase-like protein